MAADGSGQQQDIGEALAKLAQATEQLAGQRVQPEPQRAAETDYNQQIEEALAVGNTADAIRLTREAALAEQQKLALSGQRMFGMQARTQAAAEIADFKRWEQEADKIARESGIDTSQWTSVDQWRQMIDYVRGRNVQVLIEEERAKVLADARQRQAFAPGSVDVPTGLPIDVTPDMARYAYDLRVPIADYARAAAEIKEFADPVQRSYEGVPLTQDTERNEMGEVRIPPGKF